MVACKSAPKEPVETSSDHKHERDYFSINSTSLTFLADGVRMNRYMRRETRRQMWDWPDIRATNKQIRREGAAFAAGSIWGYEWDNFKRAFGTGLPREMSGNEVHPFWDSVRFGFLDSGE